MFGGWLNDTRCNQVLEITPISEQSQMYNPTSGRFCATPALALCISRPYPPEMARGRGGRRKKGGRSPDPN